MKIKTCFKCGIDKPLSSYYKHKSTKDGYLNKCKECTKTDVRNYRKENLSAIRAYDRSRGKAPHRIQARVDYAKTGTGKLNRKNASVAYIARNQDKRKAHTKVARAIKNGRLIRPEQCDVCGDNCKPHAHHWSYKKENWLDVQWVCIHCHVEIHAEQRHAKYDELAD